MAGRSLALGLAVMALPCLAQEPEAPAADPPLPALLLDLERGEFDARQAAFVELRRLGFGAKAALEEALRRADSGEFRLNLERLLGLLVRAEIEILAVDRRGTPLSGAKARVILEPYAALVAAKEDHPTRAGWSGPRVETVSTNRDGLLRFDGLWPATDVRLDLQWMGHCLARETPSTQVLRLASGPNRLVQVLLRNGSLQGRVCAGERPVEGARVGLFASQAPGGTQPPTGDAVAAAPLPSQLTDAAGRFVFESLAPGYWGIEVSHPEYLSRSLAELEVEEGAAFALPEAVQLTSRTEGLGRLRLTLLDEQDQPLGRQRLEVRPFRALPDDAARKAATVSLRQRVQQALQDPSPPGVVELTTDERGGVEIKDLEPGRYTFHLRLLDVTQDRRLAGGCVRLEAVLVRSGRELGGAPPEPARVVRLAKAGALSGHVLGASSGGALLWLLPEDDPASALLLAQFDHLRPGLSLQLLTGAAPLGRIIPIGAQGRFELQQVIPGSYTLILCGWADLQAGRPVQYAREIEVLAGQTRVLTSLRLAADLPQAQEALQALQGRVILPEGVHPAQTTLRVLDQAGGLLAQAGLGEQGEFAVAPRTPDWGERALSASGGPVWVVCEAPGCRPLQFEWEPRARRLEPLVLRLEKCSYGRARVLVTDEEGRPLQQALVSARLQPDRPSMTHASDAQGLALLGGLACGTRILEIVKEGYFLPRVPELEVRAERTTEVQVALRRGQALRGCLALPPGRDPRQATVSLLLKSWRGLVSRVTRPSRDGRFLFDGLEPGWVCLLAQAPGLVNSRPLGLAVPERGGVPEVALELEAAGDFTLRVARSFAGCEARLVEAGSWHPVWAARLPGVPAYGRQGRVGSSGLLSFTEIPSGLYDLVLAPPTVQEQVAGSRPAQAILRDLVVSAQARGSRAPEASPLLGSGVLSARLSLGAAWRRRSWRRQAELELVIDAVGRNHWAEAAFPFQALLQDQESGAAGLDFGSAQFVEPGRFTFTGLAGGEYRLYLTLRLRERLRYLLGAPSAPAQLVRSLILPEGEGMVLGAIEPALPQAFADFLEQVERDALQRALGPPCGQDRP